VSLIQYLPTAWKLDRSQSCMFASDGTSPLSHMASKLASTCEGEKRNAMSTNVYAPISGRSSSLRANTSRMTSPP
jgi:hypothetical protein